MKQTRADVIEARIILLMQMDVYVRNHIQDEDYIVDGWFAVGVPDGANLMDYEDIASDDEEFEDVCKVFAKICTKQ